MASVLVSLVNALSCSDFYKYVLNAFQCHSRCSDCFECDCETEEIPIEHEDCRLLTCCLGKFIDCDEEYTSDSDTISIIGNHNI